MRGIHRLPASTRGRFASRAIICGSSGANPPRNSLARESHIIAERVAVSEPRVIIVGGGLAGSEAAWQAARRGLRVDLHEMRPVRSTPVHATSDLAELVCSNSLKSNLLDTASGLLKEEMRRCDSLII
ncbi:MAG: FAD-dependent oxidoreductase, partial [Acidobacteria bacterium]|nr:FAD-dependent oxidoreductase [Acidobacteriota bacterium]